MCFCLIRYGFTPRLASETIDGAETRLRRIVQLIEASGYSIHDLSRCQARKRGESYRLNMPFELGIDFGCREFKGGKWNSKSILVLEEQRYRYQASISDLAGSDVQVHAGEYQIAVRKVRDWLVNKAGVENVGVARILGEYEDFQEWFWERLAENGFSDDDILEQPTSEKVKMMRDWVAKGKPVDPQ